MKCISKVKKGLALVLIGMFVSGCSSRPMVKEYQAHESGSIWETQGNVGRRQGLAAQLCVSNEEIIPEEMESLQGAGAAGLFDTAGRRVLYASKIHEKMYPASITKLMTALLFLESYQGDYTEVITASENAVIKESGAQVCGYKAGDQVSLEQLMYGLLVYSGNDAAVMIAEYVAGSEEEFVSRMNMRAVQLGATNTHFVNSHGLHDEQHYTTAYDLYLIFQKVMQFEKFREVIAQQSYEGEYVQASGKTKKINFKSTNQFLTGDQEIPQGVTVLGGKTGTTNAAGACLILLAQNAQGADYISVVLRDKDKDTLYSDMAKLLGEIVK